MFQEKTATLTATNKKYTQPQRGKSDRFFQKLVIMSIFIHVKASTNSTAAAVLAAWNLFYNSVLPPLKHFKYLS